MPEPMSSETGPRRSAPLIVLILLVIVPVASVLATLYIMQIHRPAAENRELNNQMVLQTVGLATPVHNSLDARFTDANNDGVADAPADASKAVDPDTLYFSYTATDTPETYRDVFKDFTAALAKTTGKKVEYALFTSGEDQMRALKEGKLHVTGFNTGNVPFAVDAAGFVPIVMLGSDDGSHWLQMEIVVKADSSIQSPNDLRGKELVLTEGGSNSGFKAPLVLLRSKYGLEPGRDFATRYSGGYDASIEGLANGEYEAIAVANDVLHRSEKIKPEQYRSIYKSANFPTATFGYASALKPSLAAKIKETFDKFTFKGTSLQKEFEQTKFVPVDYKNDFAIISQIDDAIGSAHKLPDVPTTRAVKAATQQAAGK